MRELKSAGLLVECKECGAKAGEECIGVPLNNMHFMRVWRGRRKAAAS